MAKKTNKTNVKIEEAPVIEEPQKDTTNPAKVEVLDMTKLMQNMTHTAVEGLDPNRRVDLLKMMHETFRVDPSATQRYNMSQETVDKINAITAIGQVAALACEITTAKNPFAIRMSKAQLEAIVEVGNEVGVNIDVKALPAPTADGTITVQSENIKVSKEAQKKIKEEHKLEKDAPELDPTKITTNEGLVNALTYILSNRLNGYEKISHSINFYKSWLKIQASKAENKDEQIKKIDEMTNAHLLEEISERVSTCPYVLNGMAHYMHTTTAVSKSPISAFAMFRNATKNKKTGVPAIDDTVIADYVKVLVKWVAKSNIKLANEKIETYKKDIDLLSKDAKANEKAIESAKEKIAGIEKSIEYNNNTIALISNPESTVPDTLIEKYKAKDADARRIFKAIVDTYYPGIDLKSVKISDVYHNVEQYAGIITNMFKEPLEKFDNYAEANIVELTKIDPSETQSEEKTENEPKQEEKKEESKN